MKLDIVKINKVHAGLLELQNIVKEKVYDKGILLKKFEVVGNDIEMLNTAEEEAILQYKANRRRLDGNFENASKVTREFTKYLDDYVKRLDEILIKLEGNKKLPESLTAHKEQLHFTDQEKNKIEATLDIDNDLLDAVLNDYNYLHFAEKRRKSLWWLQFFLRAKGAIINSVKLLLSTFAGFGVEKLWQLTYSQTPDLLIAGISALIIFFSIDRVMDKVYNLLFWMRVEKHIWKLFLHFNLYLEHMKILTQNNLLRSA